MLHIESEDLKKFKSYNTPEKIQAFLESIPFNHEKNGETCMSPVRVLRERKAHCIEGAMFASVCLGLQGEKPLVLNLKVMSEDYDHVVTLFKRNGYYGAISKTNHAVLRYRDPVYRSIRELVMTFFHEYFLTSNGKKTLLGYSDPVNMNRFGKKWITSEEDLWHIAEKIFDLPIHSVLPKENSKYIRVAQDFERKIDAIQEWKK